MVCAGGGDAMFAHGMCKECYVHFIEVTGGINSKGANPPAFTASQLKGGTQLVPPSQAPFFLSCLDLWSRVHDCERVCRGAAVAPGCIAPD